MRRSPSKVASYLHAAPRLACVKPVASVHPEPGSNSSLYNIFVPKILYELPSSLSITQASLVLLSFLGTLYKYLQNICLTLASDFVLYI